MPISVFMNQFNLTDDTKTQELPSGFIKLRDDARFLENESALVIISPNGCLWLKSSWIKNLHSKLYSLLRKGCFEDQLIYSVDEKNRSLVKAYLKALNRSGVLLGKYSRQKNLSENRTSNNSTKGWTDYVTKTLAAEYHPNENLIVKRKGAQQILVMLDSANLLRVCNALLTAAEFGRICLVLNDSSMSKTVLFTKLAEWLLSDPPKNYPGCEEIKIYDFDEKHLNCRVKFKKHPARLLSFRDVVQKIGIVVPQKVIPQLPLAVLERNVSLEPVNEITVSVNYQPAADNIVIRELVRQTAFRDQKSAAISKPTISSEDFPASASRLELQAQLIDRTVGEIIETAEDEMAFTETDIFSEFQDFPAIHYLQTVLREKFSSMTIHRQTVFDRFYLFRAGSNKTASLCEEKAFFDLLLSITYHEYYRTFAPAIQSARFYSGYSSFVSRRKLRLMVKQSRKYLLETHGANFSNIKKTETFWGTFYWADVKVKTEATYHQNYKKNSSNAESIQ